MSNAPANRIQIVARNPTRILLRAIARIRDAQSGVPLRSLVIVVTIGNLAHGDRLRGAGNHRADS